MLSKSPSIVHFYIALGAIDHTTIIALDVSDFLTSIALLRPSFIVSFNNLKKLMIIRCDFFIDCISATDADSIFFELLFARVANEELAAASESWGLRPNVTNFALEHYLNNILYGIVIYKYKFQSFNSLNLPTERLSLKLFLFNNNK